LEGSVWIASATVDVRATQSKEGGDVLTNPELIKSTCKANFTCAFTHDDRLGEKRFGFRTKRPLNVVIGSYSLNGMRTIPWTNHEYLIPGKLAKRNGRVACHEDLEWRRSILCAKRVEQPRKSVWLKAMLDFIYKRNGGSIGRSSLKPRDKESRRPSSKRAKWNPGFTV